MGIYKDNLENQTKANDNFRNVVHTTQHLQLVLMSLNPNEEIGIEVHETTDQFFRVDSGKGKFIIDGQEFEISDGDAFIIPSGSEHNIVNTQPDQPLKLYTIYAPPHHKDGVVHKTKAEAESDTTDHL